MLDINIVVYCMHDGHDCGARALKLKGTKAKR